MKHSIKAAIYCRVATPDQLSLDRQEQHICDFARTKGYGISSIIKECFKGTTMSRPGIQRVLSNAKKGTMNILLVYSASRIGRNTAETIHFIRQLGEYGVAVESVKEGALLNELLEFIGKALAPEKSKS